MTQGKVVVVDFQLPRDAYGKVQTFQSIEERAEQIAKKAYDDALAKIIAKAKESNW